MKKYFILVCLLFAFRFVPAQQSSLDSLYKKMALELCDELKAKETELRNSENLELDLGLIMLPVFSKHSDELEKYIPDFSPTNQEMISHIAEKTGEKLAIGCPLFLKLASEKMNMDNADDEKEVNGAVDKINPGDFTSILFKTPGGEVLKLWWLEYFPGDNLVKKSAKLTVKYKEVNIYNQVTGKYVAVKVLTHAVQ
ncbi:MAG: hypothetical protein QM687_10420 [Ferruginibacter sp.]